MRQVKNDRATRLTMHDLDTEVLAAPAAGADDYCVKSGDPHNLIAAVQAAAEGGAFFDPAVAHIVLRKLGNPSAKERYG